MRILVAGGAGFVGSHLVERLLESGHTVVVVDNLLTGRAQNLAHLRGKRLSVVRADAAKTPGGRYDRVYHLASPASPIAYTEYPIETLLVNAVGTHRLLEVARRASARFLLASTSEIYGDPLVHPQPETYWGNVNPIGPRSQYDEGKRFAEALTVAYVRAFGLYAVIARIFNAYGPRMQLDDGRMPSSFITAALEHAPITVHGDGSQTRSLCFVSDTVNGLIAAMERGKPGEAYNIGRADEISVLDFAQAVRRYARSRSEIVHIAARPETIRRRRPDLRKSTRHLSWHPRWPLSAGLRETITWCRDEMASRTGGRARVSRRKQD